MIGTRTTRTAAVIVLWGIASGAHWGLNLPAAIRLAAAMTAILVLPGWWVAGALHLRRDSFRIRLPLGFGLTHGLLALFALLFHLAGFPLSALLALVAFISLGAAFFHPVWTRRSPREPGF